jgi:diguanylate cyclase (GGDEF)-like protein
MERTMSSQELNSDANQELAPEPKPQRRRDTDIAAAVTANASVDHHMSESFEARIARFERMGMRLFGVAHCFVSFGNLAERFDANSKSMTALAAAFCDSVPFQSSAKIHHDVRRDTELATHKLVVGAPYVRFYASFPLLDSKHNVIGNVALVDFQVMEFDEQDALLLTDLALLVERELALAHLYQHQLDLIKQNRNLKRDSMIDPQLGTWNKSAIVRSLSIEMERCTKAAKPLSLVFVSWEQSAAIRAKYGSANADMLMLKMVSRIRSCIRPFDALGRFDNDVFLIVLPGASNLVLTAVIGRIKLAIVSHPETIDDSSLTLSIAVGHASTDVLENAEPESMMAEAEKSLFAARSALAQS